MTLPASCALATLQRTSADQCQPFQFRLPTPTCNQCSPPELFATITDASARLGGVDESVVGPGRGLSCHIQETCHNTGKCKLLHVSKVERVENIIGVRSGRLYSKGILHTNRMLRLLGGVDVARETIPQALPHHQEQQRWRPRPLALPHHQEPQRRRAPPEEHTIPP